MSDLDTAQRPSRRLWILAALAALALHLGGAALAFGHLKTDEDDGALGAAGAEYAVEMESPKLPEDDLPPGPDSDAVQASQQQVEQKAELKQTDLPQERPNVDEEADRLVSPNNTTKPQEEDPKVAAVQTEAAPEQEASEATARQTLDDKARESDAPKAANSGIGKDNHVLAAKWMKQISAYLELHLRYPKVPQRKDKEVTVMVALVLNRQGHVVSLGIANTSGDPLFDEAAMSMVHRSDPVPKPPAALTDDTFSYVLPVKFNKPK